MFERYKLSVLLIKPRGVLKQAAPIEGIRRLRNHTILKYIQIGRFKIVQAIAVMAIFDIHNNNLNIQYENDVALLLVLNTHII